MRSKTKQFLHYEKVLSKKDLSNCDILLLKTWWQSGLRRQIQKTFLWAFGTRMCAWVRILQLSKFAFKSQQFVRSRTCENETRARWSRIYLTRECYRKPTEAIAIYDFWRQDGRAVLGDRPKGILMRLLAHESVRGFQSHSCQSFFSKRQHLVGSSIRESQTRSKI